MFHIGYATSTKPVYVCIEGAEGVGKTTQCDLLVKHFSTKEVVPFLRTKEPGTPLLPLTMELRKIMLDNQYESQMTVEAREYISQAIRAIHLEKLINVQQQRIDLDLIIQDRGLLSGVAYGNACGNSLGNLLTLAHITTKTPMPPPTDFMREIPIYDHVIFLKTNRLAERLSIAKSAKQEFAAGDAMESRPLSFYQTVQDNMEKYLTLFGPATTIDADQSIEAVHRQILAAIWEGPRGVSQNGLHKRKGKVLL